MFGPFERAVAGRYLRARRGERFVSVIAIFSLIGIGLGVATLIIVMAVMNGFRADLMSRILGLNGDLTIYGVTRSITDYENIAKEVAAVPGVRSVTPLIEGQVLLSAGNWNSGGMVHGMTRQDFQNLKAVSGDLIDGSLDKFDGDGIAVGVSMAEQAGLTLGSAVTLISPNGAATAFGTVPRMKTYHIVAIFDAGVNDYNKSYVFMPLASAQVYFEKPGQVTQMMVMTNDPDNARSIAKTISDTLADPRIRVLDWTHSNNAFFGALEVQKNVLFLILTLIILVAAFNVISSLIMMVRDKTVDIAVLRTMGATRGAIMRIFLMCGASVGVTGTVAGTIFGVVFCHYIDNIRQLIERMTGTALFNPEVYYLVHLPARLIWSQVLEVIVMALTLSLLATLYPSWRAARTDPVEALRHG
ncbi:MAG: lipoprotein-releasing ABC transporter permease subunit [Acetobacter sp.]|jgi:lipoprotein-releasing system permease protein|nr:lipoprotein-releasing ABC transporter permease subunit [Acetobacter sp.]MCH4061948.1 lipoprotein-releasing ABC transporter permease subunit [Acetobacter sp.]MCH4089203.1 lipoprotein-releasing ABC transporter permease subunit [Acetobacter sp.]MCI1293625.1 lipoprotein-releasing ABC transporter permease subunit [Acetobacter sp.]MCI1320294.1 lipoprotein-releasing ABC transporter permease subunit [Acetobacter sp.]